MATDNSHPIISSAWNIFEYSTLRNPWLMRRIGGSGWDPRTHKWLSKLNRFLAPDAHAAYKKLGRPVRSAVAASKHYKHVGPPYNKYAQIAARREASAAAYKKSMDRISKKFFGGHAGVDVFESATKSGYLNPTTAAERALAKHTAAKYGGGRAFKLLLKPGARLGAAMYLAGRFGAAAGGALWLYDLAKLGAYGFEVAAEYGKKSLLQPTTSWGSGVVDTPRAATIRQEALAQMHGSEFGPRRLIGNEAQFLHV